MRPDTRVNAIDRTLNATDHLRARAADIVFTRARVAVFIDGCYWHGCPGYYRPARVNAGFWEAKIAGNLERDERSTESLRAAGWTVLRFWEHEDADAVAAVIAEAVGGAQSRASRKHQPSS